MEDSPTKKKKKYIKKNPTSTDQDTTEQSIIISNKPQGNSLERMPIHYDFEQLINHVLARILPTKGCSILLKNNVVMGQRDDLDELKVKLQDNAKNTKGLMLELKQQVEREDIEYQLKENYDWKIFTAKIVERFVDKFFQNSPYQEDYESFLKQFDEGERQRLFLRLNRSDEKEIASSLEELADVVSKVKAERQRQARGNRKNIRTEAESVQFSAADFDLKDFKHFIKGSSKLEMADFNIDQRKDIYGKVESYKITLVCFEQHKQNKLYHFKIYFQFQSIVRLPVQDSPHKQAVCSQFEQRSNQLIKIRFYRGYKSSKWDDKELLHKIYNQKISKKKTNYNNQYFQVMHVTGLRPIVWRTIEELETALNEVPLDNIQKQIFIEFQQNIKDILRDNDKVETFLRKFIEDYVNTRYSHIISLKKLKFKRVVILCVHVQSDKEKQFQNVENELERIMVKEVSLQQRDIDYPVEQDLLQKLDEEGFIVVSHKEKSFTYIQITSEIAQYEPKLQTVLRDFDKVTQQMMEVRGKAKLNKYMQIINQIKSRPENQQILVADPTSEDKVNFKICFYGPKKKNQQFVKMVKEQIENVEKELGEYSQLIEERISKLFLDDQFQDDIQRKFGISLIVNPARTVEAKIEIVGLKTKTMIIIKSTNLDRVLFGSRVVFSNKDQLMSFKEKYLDSLKAKAKRSALKDPIMDSQKCRNISFIIKEMNDPIDILSVGAKDYEGDSVVLIMPKLHKEEFIEGIIKCLMSNDMLFISYLNLCVIEPDPTTDIDSTVGLPEYSNTQTQQTYEWSSDFGAYSKTGNIKINDAIVNRSGTVILEQQDFSKTDFKETHKCNIFKETITHLYTGQQTPIKIFQNSVTFTINKFNHKFPQSEANRFRYCLMKSQKQFTLALPLFIIDPTAETQTNIFTGHQSKIQKKTVKNISNTLEDKVRAYYNQNKTELIYSFPQQNARNIGNCRQQISAYVQSKEICEAISLQKNASLLDERNIQRILERSAQFQLQASWNRYTLTLNVKSFDPIYIQNFKKILQFEISLMEMAKKLSKREVQDKTVYPHEWQPQRQEIEVFEVNRVSVEFMQIQQLFTVRNISSLSRIQNKILYRKYIKQLNYLIELNEGKNQRQMKLFHGTHRSDPKVIYLDKDDGFNINYSSQSNSLGRGVYFAAKSEYSYNYAWRQRAGLKIIGSMMLCSVIVGDSQPMTMSPVNRDVKDTEYKDPIKRIRYQSMKGISSIGEIYVVYKMRRAYPMYLIKFES